MPIFTANIPTPLKVGDRIEIGGKIKENARKMSVNLCAQEGEEPRDVVLHFDVRFHRDNIISLSRKNGIWIGSGNYDTNYNMFVPGTLFRIVFEVKDTDVITIYCQGKFHSNFLPKIPLIMARFVVAWADVEKITHCYFYLNNKNPVSGDETGTAAAPAVSAYAPRTPMPTMVMGDVKRCQRTRKKGGASASRHQSSQESSEDEEGKNLQKADGRADRYFYDTLMCQPPESAKYRADPSPSRNKAGFSRKQHSDTEKVESDEYSEEICSRNMDSSIVESEDMPHEARRRNVRRNKVPFAQIVNFTGKPTKRT